MGDQQKDGDNEEKIAIILKKQLFTFAFVREFIDRTASLEEPSFGNIR